MSFVRPEAKATLWRWREALSGGCGLALGIWWIMTGSALTRGLGLALALAAAALLIAGIQRGRFRGRSGGLGIVTADEGQVAYFGPLTGGIVALNEMSELSFDPGGRPAHWVLSQPGQPDLFIPVDAEGADALFDAFTRLPGLSTEKVLAVLNRKEAFPERVPLWRRNKATVLGQPSH